MSSERLYSKLFCCINFTVFPRLKIALGYCFVDTQQFGFLDAVARNKEVPVFPFLNFSLMKTFSRFTKVARIV